MQKITIRDSYIKLGQAMKLSGLAESGIDAKEKILDGGVSVNGMVDKRRGRKLYPGDHFSYEGEDVLVEGAPAGPDTL